MYWPIGAPRIYAASKHELLPKHSTTSDDGLGEKPQTQEEASSAKNGTATQDQDGDSEIGSDDRPNGNSQHSSQSGADSQSRAKKVKSNGETKQGTADDAGGEIVGLKVTRSGHMFATITRSTLTVWQTKVDTYHIIHGTCSDSSLAYSSSCICAPLTKFTEDLWTKYRGATPSRLSHYCYPNLSGLPDHLLFSDRPQCPSVQNHLCRPFWWTRATQELQWTTASTRR